MSEERLEFRPDHKGRFDEIVARNPDVVHVETMTKGSVYSQFNFGYEFSAALTSRAGKTAVCDSNRLASHVQTQFGPE